MFPKSLKTSVLVCLGFLVFGVPVSSSAQERLPVYLSGGWFVSSETTSTKALTFGGGLHVTPSVAVDAAFTWRSDTSDVWLASTSFLGLAPYTLRRSAQHDRSLILSLRYRPSCLSRVCVELVGGGGNNSLREVTSSIADCATSSADCVPRSSPSVVHTETFNEWVVAGGADVRFKIGKGIEFGPSLRLSRIFRHGCGTYGRACFIGPEPPASGRADVGVTATWRSR